MRALTETSDLHRNGGDATEIAELLRHTCELLDMIETEIVDEPATDIGRSRGAVMIQHVQLFSHRTIIRVGTAARLQGGRFVHWVESCTERPGLQSILEDRIQHAVSHRNSCCG
jgi:hypothetical protein